MGKGKNMKKIFKWMPVSSLVLLAFGIAGCAGSTLQSRTAQIMVKGKTYEAQMKGERNLTSTDVGFYVNGMQLGENKKFWPLASSGTFEGKVDGNLFESMCTLNISGNGWLQNVNCVLYANKKEQESLSF